MLCTLRKSMHTFAGKFSASRSGNVAMIYGLALLPMIAAVGSAVDLTRAMVVKMRLGEALDAAGLAVGGTIGLTDAEMTDKAQKFFYANYPDAELGTVTGLSISSSGYNKNNVNVSGTARVDTAFMGLFGIKYLDVAVGIQVTRESKGLEIALALDNTGSMASSGKLTALKSAANELIDILFGDQTSPSHLKMSLVPFSQTVKVDPTVFTNNGWVDINGQSSTARLNFDNNQYAFSVMKTMKNQTWLGCVEARPGNLEMTDTPPDAGTPDTRWVPYFEPDGPDSSAYSGYVTYLTDGVTGNQETRLKRSAKYVNQNKTNPQADCNLQKIQPLTNNKTTLKLQINNMIATGNTHVALGAAWGWRTLSPEPPYTEGSQYGDNDWTKAMVLLTDGTNTTPYDNTFHKSSYTAYNYLVRNQLGTTNGPNSEIAQDTRTLTTCTNAKNAGIRIYTILLNETAQRAKNLMAGCATVDPNSPSANAQHQLYYDSPSASDLKAIFQNIANDLSNLRLSQ